MFFLHTNSISFAITIAYFPYQIIWIWRLLFSVILELVFMYGL